MMGKLFLPKGIDDKIIRAVKNQAAKKFGGYTVVEGKGGWHNKDENEDVEFSEIIREDVEIIKIAGCNEEFVQSAANWIAKRSDESEVMWQIAEIKTGFES